MIIFKKIIPSRFKKIIKESVGAPSLEWSLKNIKQKKFNPGFIVDVGAYQGDWTIAALKVFPSAKVLMVEAQKNKEAALLNITKRYPNADYIIALVSSEDDTEKLFLENESASHITDKVRTDHAHNLIHTKSLDTLLQNKNFPFPDFLKLDVQGHEMEVLKGAPKSLAHAEICIIEISLLNIGADQPLLTDMIAYMDENDFQAYDISQFMRRPFDKALFQMDVFFIKKNSPLIAEKRWN